MLHHVVCATILAALSPTFLHGCGGGGSDDPGNGGGDDSQTKTTTSLTSITTTTTTQNLRGQALCNGELVELYHQTDMPACRSILEGGFDLGRATPGNQGMGTYFANDAAHTAYKTRHHGCVIKVLARVGNVFHMKDDWLPDMQNNESLEGLGIPNEAGCDTLFGYKLMKKNFQSIATDKHGAERAIFFDDQILDMVAYPTRRKGRRSGGYLNGRSELKYPESCDPDDYPQYEPPPCKFDGAVQREACAGFTNAGCFTTDNGNVNAEAGCTGTVLKSATLDWGKCNKECFDNRKCQGFQWQGGDECKMYSDVPSAVHWGEGSGAWCMKKVSSGNIISLSPIV